MAEGISPKISLNLSPILVEQLADQKFPGEFTSYLEQKIEGAREDHHHSLRTGEGAMALLARKWETFYTDLLNDFRESYGQDLVGRFRRLQDQGHIQILTCAATHGYLPLLRHDENVQAQIKQGVATYRRHFGRSPKGIWLPECAYRPRYPWAPPLKAHQSEPLLRKGVEEILSENGLGQTIVDAHLLRGGEPIGVYRDRFEALRRLWQQYMGGTSVPSEEKVKNPHTLYWVNAGRPELGPVAIFTRDPQTGLQVWSGEHGYPGDPWYLEFHKKHWPGGHRYWRVSQEKTSLADKALYDPARAVERTAAHASHFVELCRKVLREAFRDGHPPVLCAPYDAELFGHWWFEGPRWLGHVLRTLGRDPELRPVTLVEAQELSPPQTVIALPEGSWGEGGGHWVWLNEWTEWTWEILYQAESDFRELARQTLERGDAELDRLVRQAARELLLLEASDWQFLITTWSARDYAQARFTLHSKRLRRLAEAARRHMVNRKTTPEDREFLALCEEADRPFQDVDLGWFAWLDHPAVP